MDNDIRGTVNTNALIKVLQELYEAAEDIAPADDMTNEQWARYEAAAKKAKEVLNG